MATIALPVLVAARYLAFIPFGLYRSIWRYAGSRDLVSIAGAVVVSEASSLGYVAATRPFGDFSRSFFIIDALFCTVGDRRVSRLAERAVIGGTRTIRDRTGRRTIIVGAGRTGRSLLRELRETGGERVLGFVDDNPRLRRRRVHGAPVLGGTHELAAIVARTRPTSCSSRSPTRRASASTRSCAACGDAGVACRFVRRETDLDPRVVLGASAE